MADLLKYTSAILETKLKTLESRMCYREKPKHIYYKEKREKLYQENINEVIIRSDCGWLILKSGIIQNYIITISCDEKEITDEKKITDKLFKFYKVLFQKKNQLLRQVNSGLFKENWNSETDYWRVAEIVKG